MKQINIGKEFSPYPAGRYLTDGDYSGERFREEILIPSLMSNGEIHIYLDDTRGYDSSFLEEAFGGIFREKPNLDCESVMAKIKFMTDDRFLADEIKGYMLDACRQRG